MTEDETLTLMMALTSEKPLRLREIALSLECTSDHARYLTDSLRSAGVLTKPRYGEVAITEKGRIACALAMVKDPSLRAAFMLD